MARADVHRFYFLDEMGLRLDYTCRYARAAGGRRVSGAVPLQRGRAVTLVGALGVRGLTAVQLLDGALNQRRFAFYVARVLGPQLRRGDVLGLNYLPVHKLGGLQQELARRGVEVLSCRRTRPISPRSRRPGANSKPRCAKPRPAPLKTQRRRSKPRSTGSPARTPKPGSTIAAIMYTVYESTIS